MSPHTRILAVTAVLVGLLTPMVSEAQVAHDPQIWTAVLGNAKLNDEDRGGALWLDVHLRRSGSNLVHIARPGIGYRAAPWLSVWAGYALVPVLPDEGELVIEHRPWQQVILKHKLDSGISLQSRTRFEQRFLSTGSDVGLRVREFVRFSAPLDEEKKLGVVAWDELFVALNDTDWGAQTGLDQNRLFVGPYLITSSKTRLELGYLFVYLNRSPSDTIGHVLATNVFWAL